MQAWLDTTRKDADKNRRADWQNGEPEPGRLSYIGEWLYEIGAVSYSGSGAKPIGWPDIAAWVSLSRVDPEPWESAALKDIADAYFSQYLKSAGTDEPPPWFDASKIDHNAQALRARRRHGRS